MTPQNPNIRVCQRRRTLSLIGALCGLFVASAAPAQTFTVKAVSAPVLNRPHDMAIDAAGTHLYVSDMGNDAIKVLDAQSLVVLGEFGRGELRAPHDVTFDRTGRLLVADTGNDRIAAYEVDGPKGRLAATVISGLAGPEGVAVGPGGELYVANAAGDTAAVYVDGKLVATAGGHGTDLRFNRPHDVEVGPDARVWVADPGSNRLVVLDPQLKHVATIGGAGYDFREPKYFALDGRGWAYVADQYNDRLQVLNNEGRVVSRLEAFPYQGQTIRLNHPEGVVLHGPHIWSADTYNDRVVLFVH